MIDPRELRIGNYFYDDENAVSILNGMTPFGHSSRCDEPEGCILLLDYYKGGELMKGYECDSNASVAIPLSEEWLLKFGFEKKPQTKWHGNGADYQPNDSFTTQDDYVLGEFIVRNEKWTFRGGVDTANYIVLGNWYPKCSETEIYGPSEHVHKLQNLYYSLIGNELEVK